MLTVLLPNVRFVRLVQLLNAFTGMFVTLLGIVIVVKLAQPWNASAPMLTMLSGISTPGRLEQL